MKFRYSLKTLYSNLYAMGMDDCPYKSGYAKEEDDVRDGQECTLLSLSAFTSSDEMVIVKWADGETSELSFMSLVEI